MQIGSPSHLLNPVTKIEPIDFESLIDASISKPARYMGHEHGVKTFNWSEASVRWTLAYPELYEVGASNLGHIILYSILNNCPGQVCDRAYLPGNDLATKLRETSQPLFAVESRRPLYAFDILGFSLSYELGATNILEMLNLSGIPIYSSDRGDLPQNHPAAPPIIFAGGPSATSNPEPYAAFFDFVALGDGEELLPEIGLVIKEGKESGISRLTLLKDLAQIPGVYVPCLYKTGANGTTIEPIEAEVPTKILRRVAKPIPHYGMGLVPNIQTVHDRLTIEIRRGCTRGCRFCQPGMLTRPARDVDPEEVISAVQSGMEKTGYSDFSLLSLSCSDYLALPSVGVELRNRLAEQNVTLQLPSQRIDRFDENIAHILGGTRQAGLTFAPEAGTQRLRDIINKGLTDADLLKGIQKAMESGYRKIKLYFMIGLPGETDDDVLGIPQTCQMLQRECLPIGRLRLNITISNFTPKPHTPFQWHSVSSVEFLRKQELLKQSFKTIKGVKVNFTDVRLSFIEDFIGRGDRRLTPVIEAAWKAGAGMDAWFESVETTHKAWANAIEQAGLTQPYRDLELGNYSFSKSFQNDELKTFCAKELPWDHIETGVDKHWLAEDFQKALAQQIVPDCSFAHCSSCGVCGPELGHNVLVKQQPIPKQKAPTPPPSNRACRIRVKFSKTKQMSLISHLDMVRLFQLALRRSNLPISYTGGFHPLPRLQVALALPLGIEALGEWMDLEFTKPINALAMIQVLQGTLPQGLKLLSASEVPVKGLSLSQELSAARWSFSLEANSKQIPTKNEWELAVQEIINAKELLWRDRDKKGKQRIKDFKESLHRLEIESVRKVNQDGLSKTSVHLKLLTLIDPCGRSIKPMQVQHWAEEKFGSPLIISNLKRQELLLHQC